MGDPKKGKGGGQTCKFDLDKHFLLPTFFFISFSPRIELLLSSLSSTLSLHPRGSQKKNWQGPCMMWMRPTHVNPKRCGLFVLAGTKRAQNVSFVFVVAPARIMHWFLASLCATRCCFCPWKREVRQKPSTGVRSIVCLPFFPLLCMFIPFFQPAVLFCYRSCKGEARRYIQSLCFALCLPFPLPVLLRRILFM